MHYCSRDWPWSSPLPHWVWQRKQTVGYSSIWCNKPCDLSLLFILLGTAPWHCALPTVLAQGHRQEIGDWGWEGRGRKRPSPSIWWNDKSNRNQGLLRKLELKLLHSPANYEAGPLLICTLLWPFSHISNLFFMFFFTRFHLCEDNTGNLGSC